MKTLFSLLLAVPMWLGMATPPAAPGSTAESIRVPPLTISTKGRDLIVYYEVGGRAYYEKSLQGPTYPGGASGVTVGFGYDLGYNSAAQIRSDWSPYLPKKMVDAMVSVAGLKGSRAAAALSGIKWLVQVPWETARTVFEKRTMPRFAVMVGKAFPEYGTADPHGQAVLLSLGFNRGTSMAGESRREMRWVRDDLRPAPSKVPGHVRTMKRLWYGKGLDGLLKRRDAEAALFQEGLSGK